MLLLKLFEVVGYFSSYFLKLQLYTAHLATGQKKVGALVGQCVCGRAQVLPLENQRLSNPHTHCPPKKAAMGLLEIRKNQGPGF